MTETAKAVIDKLQGEAGHATGGEVDRLVFSGLDVHTMLNEIEQAIDTDKLSVEKLQQQLNSKVKALTEIRANIEEHNQIYDLDTNTALLLEGIDGIAFDALETIENEGSGDE